MALGPYNVDNPYRGHWTIYIPLHIKDYLKENNASRGRCRIFSVMRTLLMNLVMSLVIIEMEQVRGKSKQ